MTRKKKIILIACIAGGIALLLGILFLIRALSMKPVPVYSVAEISYTGDESEMQSSGTVRAEGIQSVMLSSTQTVKEVFVTKGSSVKEGDVLFSYDTTITEIELERLQIQVKQAGLQIQKEQKQLSWINSLVPSGWKYVEPDNSWIHYYPITGPGEAPYLMVGEGTKDDPKYYIIDKDYVFDQTFLKSILAPDEPQTYAVFLIRHKNAINGEIEKSYAFILSEDASGGVTLKPFEVTIPESISKADIPEDPYYEHTGSEYTAEEIARMRIETEASIKEQTIQQEKLSLEYQKKQLEASDNVVRAKISGTVTTIRNPETAKSESKPVIVISAGGGYYIDSTYPELQLGTIKVGDTVTVDAYASGILCEGTITAVSEMPSPKSGSGSNNPNMSYYPFTVQVPADSGLTEGENVTLDRSNTNAENAVFYIDNMFILQENGTAFVWAANADGRLEKRIIKTGRRLYDTNVEIREGLTKEDFIAFPYGKNVFAGAKTEVSDLSSLYNSY